MKQQKLTSHEFYLGIIAEICQEMGYEIVDKKYDSAIDLQVRNPKNGRVAIIELETTFQRQKQQHQKYAKRYKLIQLKDILELPVPNFSMSDKRELNNISHSIYKKMKVNDKSLLLELLDKLNKIIKTASGIEG